MHITYDDAFDTGTFPGPGNGGPVAGEVWVGLSGFLGLLEGLTGLSRPWPSQAERVASLVPRLTSTPGFWAASAKTDALSTAERLLSLRDALVLHGWTGGVQSPRLQALEHLALAPTGSAGDRLNALTATLPRFPKLVEKLHLLTPRASLPLALQHCITALEDQGTRVGLHAAPPPGSSAQSDLAGARSRQRFAPQGDHSLQLIRPYGPLAAAEAVAAALAATRTTPTLLIGADGVLDQALARHGLPTVGGAGDASDNAMLQLLPLVIAMGAQPQDPARVVELLTLQTSPVPRGIARGLVEALQTWPAIGSPDWNTALAEGLAALDDDKRDGIAQRLASLFHGTVSGSVWPVAELFSRTQLLRTWLLGRERHETDDDARARFGAAIGQCAEFDVLLRATDLAEVSTAQLRLLLERAASSAAGSQRYAASAGLRAVGQPGGVAGPIARIVWWNFTLASAPSPQTDIWSKPELAALAEAGVELPGTGAQARLHAQRFVRPLQHATSALWLVCPERADDGSESAPHPLWDEVLGVLKESRLAESLTFEQPQLAKPLRQKQRAALPLPGPRLEWKTSVRIKKREQESASSIESLLGCPLHWTLSYVGKLRSGQTASLPADKQLLGSFAHEVVGKTMESKPASPAAAAADVEQRFKDLGPTHAAPLFLPGRDAERTEALQAARTSASQLAKLLTDGWEVESVEESYEGQALGTALRGYLDLVLRKGKARAVVDLKWSGERYRRDSLTSGAALQLSTYAELLRQNGATDVPVAYFILISQTMLSADARLLGKSAPLEVTHDAQATWKSVEAAWKTTWKAVAKGELAARGVDPDAPEDTVHDEDGAVSVTPPCRYCEYSGLCGRLYGTMEAADGED